MDEKKSLTTTEEDGAGVALPHQSKTVVDWEFLQRQAQVLLATNLVKKIGDGVVKLWMGREIGVPDSFAIQEIHIIPGKGDRPAKLSTGTNLMRSLLAQAGVKWKTIESDDEHAIVEMIRKGWEPEQVEFNIETARRQKYIKPGGSFKDGDVWQVRPSEMCWKSAFNILARRLCADILQGALYDPDEITLQADDYRVVASDDDESGLKLPHDDNPKAKEIIPAAGVTVKAAETDDFDFDTSRGEPTPMTVAQIGEVKSLCKKLGIKAKKRDEKVLEYYKKKYSDLTIIEGQSLITRLDNTLKKQAAPDNTDEDALADKRLAIKNDLDKIYGEEYKALDWLDEMIDGTIPDGATVESVLLSCTETVVDILVSEIAEHNAGA